MSTIKKSPNSPKLDKAELQKALRIAHARKTLPAFVSYVLRDANGNPVTPAPHQVAWSEHINYSLEIGKIPVILAPMGHAKTNWVAIAYPLYLLGLNPNIRIMIVSSSEDIAVERLQTIDRYIRYSNEYHEVFPWVEIDNDATNTSHRLNVKRFGLKGAMVGSVNASVMAFGYESRGAIGSRTDVLLVDDVADEKNSVVEAGKRDKLRGIMATTYMTRPENDPIYTRDGELIAPGSIVVVIGTRYHEEDYYADPCMSNSGAYCTTVQAVSGDFTHLNCEVIGALANPPHPTATQFASYDPTA